MAKKIIPKDASLPLIKIIATILIVGIAVVGALIYINFTGSSTVEGANISVNAPSEVLLGTPFELDVNITNDSSAELRDVELKLFLPDEITLIENPEQAVLTKQFGLVRSGEVIRETFTLVALSGEKTAKDVVATLNYTTKNVSSHFNLEEKTAINIGEPGLRLDARYPNEVLSGEEFNIDFLYVNVAQVPFDNVSLELEYPAGFEYLEANKKPAEGDNVWDLGTASINASDKITVLSRVFGRDGSFYNVTGKLIVTYRGHSFPVDITTASFAIANSPLSIDIKINNQDDYTARRSENLKYQITYTNNTDVGLKDVIVKAQLVGEMYDISSLKAGAFFESTNNTITWNASRVPGLKLLPPGETGVIDFSIRTRENFPIRQLSDKNYTLRLIVTVESPTVPFFVASKKTSATTELETRVEGEIDVDAQAYFRDAGSGMLNKGPFPPRVNIPTEYTIHWVISTRAVDVENIEVRTFLQSGVRWTGNVTSNAGDAVPIVNERTSEVVWFIDETYANKGVADEPLEAIFQVEATPSLLELGDPMPLIGETTITATDVFTGSELNDIDEELSSDLPDDPTIQGRESGVVVQ